MNTNEQQPICPRFEKALELLGKRWISLIVFCLMDEPRRFSEIEAAVTNLSGKVLTDRLKDLEAEGIVARHVYPEMPVRIEYALTDKGKALAPIFGEVAKWSSEWVDLNNNSSNKSASHASSDSPCS